MRAAASGRHDRPRRDPPPLRREGVARQKTPEHLEIVDALPRSLSGKVRKVDPRDRLRNNILDS